MKRKVCDKAAPEMEVLILKARSALEQAYAPYSEYRVGAALLAGNGAVYTGINVENSSYGLAVCAERVAVFKAVSEGRTDFEALAVAADHGGPPRLCGACLQVLTEFSDDMPIFLAGAGGRIEETSLSRLLPHPFRIRSPRED